MKSWLFPMTGAAVLVGTLFGGWLHGRFETRWGADDLLAAAGKQLQQPLAEQHGNWRLVSETPFSSDVVQMLQCPAHINRRYMHQQTGDVVNVFLIVGPPGPTSVHRPEVCYGSQNYIITSGREPLTVVDRTQAKHSLWQVVMEPRKVDGVPLRVFYGWGTGNVWSATVEPRFAHAGEPYLYKIQLSSPLNNANDEFNPCADFLSWFLPEIQMHLIPTHQDSAVVIPSDS